MIVIDASAVAELLLARPSAPAVAQRMTDHGFDLHAPHLLDAEVLSVIRRVVASGDASAERGEQALDDFLGLPVERHPHDVLLRRAWDYRENFTAYDAMYVTLAQALAPEPVPVLTTDARLARAIRAHTDVTAVSL